MAYRRIKDMGELVAAVAAFRAEHGAAARMEAGIYSDNNGLTWRPQVGLWVEGKPAEYNVVVRWYAFADEEVDHFKRIAAREHAEAIVSKLG